MFIFPELVAQWRTGEDFDGPDNGMWFRSSVPSRDPQITYDSGNNNDQHIRQVYVISNKKTNVFGSLNFY